MRIKFFLVMVMWACPMLAQADLVVQGRRIIYDEARGETIVPIQQTGKDPRLVQNWLDTGDDTLAPGMQDVPFLITPAVIRMDADAGQTIRIMRVHDGLPQDRESLFWFNTMEVPPSPIDLVEDGQNFLQFAARIRIKFFYRPKGLQPTLNRAVGMLSFSSAGSAPDGRVQVRVHNPSPYHMTFRNLTLRPGVGEDAPVLADMVAGNWMVAPMDDLVVLLQPAEDLPEPLVLPGDTRVMFGVINDYGGEIAGQQGLSQGE